MTENKTKATVASVTSYLAGIEDAARRKDCQTLTKLITKATNQKPKMWGSSIVGFGSYHYKYASGREGDYCVVGFASRKGDITIYATAGLVGRDDLLAKLGKHKVGKGCLYIRTLGDVDLNVLQQIITASFEERQNHNAKDRA